MTREAVQNKILPKRKANIFDFQNYREFLLAAGLPDGMYSHTSNNLKNWAKRLGYRSPSSLTMVIKGQRVASPNMVDALIEDLKLTKREGKHLKLLVELEKSQREGKDATNILKELARLSTQEKSFKISLHEFNAISDWHSIVIKQLIDTPDFIYDLEWIHRRLRRKVSISQIKTTIEALLDLELVKKTKDGGLVPLKKGFVTPNDIPSNAIKNHHEGMVIQGLKAIREQEPAQRQIVGNTLKVDEENLPEAKEAIFDFVKEFNERFSSGKSSNLYQLNIQFFTHTANIEN